MPLSGEAIRTMNYVDDISVTLRRILTTLPSLTEEETSAHRHVYSQLRAELRLRARYDRNSMNIAVIGAGQAGRDFALACAGAGFHVVLEDVMPAKLRHAEQAFASLGATVGTGFDCRRRRRERRPRD